MPGERGWKSSRQNLWDKVWTVSNSVCAGMIEGGCKDTSALLRGDAEEGRWRRSNRNSNRKCRDLCRVRLPLKAEVYLRVRYITSIVSVVYMKPSGHHSCRESDGCNAVTVGI